MTVLSQTNLTGAGSECKSTMPADVTYLYGVSPPLFHNDYNTNPSYASLNRATDTFYKSPYSVFSTRKLNLSPCFARKSQIQQEQQLKKSLKSCIKPNQQKFEDFPSKQQPTTDLAVKIIAPEATGTDLKAKIGRRVTFADFHGRSLTAVKYMTESTNEPPRSVSSGDLTRMFKNNLSLSPVSDRGDTASSKTPKFVLKFAQPISNYLRFKQLLEKKNVCLENVVVKDNHTLHGTVKVRNLSFQKDVALRLTCDKWATYKDFACQYVKDAYENGAFDTFQFTVSIPTIAPNIDCVEFCIKFSSPGYEFWDNYDGVNYQIAVSHPDAVKIPQRQTVSRQTPVVSLHLPSTYNELPGPQFNTWNEWEGSGPFY